MRRVIAFTLTACMASQQCLAGAQLPPSQWSGFANQSLQTANRTSWLTHKPYGNGLTQLTATQYDRTSGNPCVYTAELEDNFSAVQIAFASDNANSVYTVQQAVVSGSAMYGPNNRPGTIIYDYAGNAQTGMFPVTFNGGGAVGDPFSSIPAARNSDTTGGVGIMYANVTSGGASGATTAVVSFPGATTIQGGVKVLGTMYVSDGTGTAIPAGTTATLSGSTITFSQSLTASLAANQVLYFSYTPLTFSLTVPASTNPVQPQWVYSDPIPLMGLYRTDGGVQIGDGVSVAGAPAGTVVTAVTPTTVSISQALTATTAGQPAISFTRTATLTSAVPATLGLFLPLSSVTGLTTGMHVQDGSSDFPTNAVILAVQSNGVRLNVGPTNAVSGGTSLTFSHVMYPASTGSGLSIGSQTLNFVSTNSKPIISVRVAATATTGKTVSTYNQSAAGRTYEQSIGLPLNLYYAVGTAGVDIINNNLTAANTNASTTCPVFFIRYQTLHRGVDMPMAGDSMTAGKTTATDSMNYGRIAAASISKPTLPIETPNFAISGQWGNDFLTSLSQYITDTKPPVVFLQGMDRNSVRDTAPQYYAQMMGLASRVLGYGGRAIIATQLPWGAAAPGDFIVASDVNNSTTIPVKNSVVNTLTGVAAYATGLPLGTVTLNMSHYAFTLTASAPVTLSAGTVMHTNQLTVTSQVTSSTTIPITTPFPVNNGYCYLTGNGLPASGVLENTAAVGATTITAASAVTLSAGTVLTMNCADQYVQDRQGYISVLKGVPQDGDNSLTVFDAYAIAEDPNNQGMWLPAYTSDGIHCNDVCQLVEAAAFLPLLRSVVGR